MSNYRNGYRATDGRPPTPKQVRRFQRKYNRDLRNGGVPMNLERPAGISGHPGRRREQLAERLAVTEDRAVARALRKLERAA